MEDFADAVKELSHQIELKQNELKTKIDVERRHLAGLNTLLQRVQASKDAFDEEDCKAVRAEIEKRDTRLMQLLKECERRDLIRKEKEALFSQLHGTLMARTRILDETDNECSVLKEHDGLLRFFAEKQVALTTLLKEKMFELANAPLVTF